MAIALRLRIKTNAHVTWSFTVILTGPARAPTAPADVAIDRQSIGRSRPRWREQRMAVSGPSFWPPSLVLEDPDGVVDAHVDPVRGRVDGDGGCTDRDRE